MRRSSARNPEILVLLFLSVAQPMELQRGTSLQSHTHIYINKFTHWETNNRLHFIFHLLLCQSQWVSVFQWVLFFFFFSKSLEYIWFLLWESTASVGFDALEWDGAGWMLRGGVVGGPSVWVWREGIRTSYARQPVFPSILCVPMSVHPTLRSLCMLNAFARGRKKS